MFQLMHLYNVEQGLLSVNYLIYQVQGLSAHQVFYQFAPKAHATLGRGNENYTSAICQSRVIYAIQSSSAYALAGLYGFGHEIVYMFLEKFS